MSSVQYHIKIDGFQYGANRIPGPALSAPTLPPLDLKIPAGCVTGVVGRSGVGKSTLLRLIAGLLPVPVGSSRSVPVRAGRDSIAVLAQTAALHPWRTVAENVTLGSRLRGEKIRTREAQDLLRQVGLGDQTDQYPAYLSGGMQQRVALARTLYEKAHLVLLDEPFTALDTLTRLEMQTLTRTILKTQAVFMITHDLDEAIEMGDRLYILTSKALSNVTKCDRSRLLAIMQNNSS